MSDKVRLRQHIWELGGQLGEGGFGRVYAASRPGQPDAVAKFVRKERGAQRELLFADLRDARNVVPIIDDGETDDSWILVMPRAERSLLDHLRGNIAPLDIAEAVEVLTDIATALSDLDGRVVHRDLKPANVLLLDSRWCLADFGIARYAEATTALDTRKFAMSPAYAAPERWRSERASIAADVYAVGIMAYELLTGTRPFCGPAVEDFREQHLHDDPSALTNVPPQLASLVAQCLYKAPGSRPRPVELLARLSRMAQTPAAGALARLQAVNHAEVARRGQQLREESQAQSEAERREDLVGAAEKDWATVSAAIRTAILDAAPAAQARGEGAARWSIRLNQAELTLDACRSARKGSQWGQRPAPRFEVIAFSSLNLRIPRDRYDYEGRSHSFWYCDAQEEGRYQWFETAFMVSPLVPRRGVQDPFALEPGDEAAARALSRAIADFQAAWPFTPVVADLDEVIDRWAAWFALATDGKLRCPSAMPERPVQGSYRD